MAITNLTPPVVNGTPRSGQTLTTSDGTWDYDADFLSFAYAWMRCNADGNDCTVINGATGRSYTLTPSDIGSRIRARLTATEGSNPTPPPGAQPITNSITSGGTYTGSISGTVFIRTLQPVVFDHVTFSGGSGTMINAYHDIPGVGVDLTVKYCTFNGANAWDSPRWITAQHWKNLVLTNNTINNTRGIELWATSYNNPTTSILRNKHTNPKGTTSGGSLGSVGNFIQMRVIWGGPMDGGTNPNPGIIDIGWNEIISQYGQSNAEDIFSIYKTARTRIHDNLINGQSKPPGMGSSSQNSITIDPHQEPALLYDNQITDNFVIDAYAIGMFGGNNNLIHDNFIISDGKIADTGINMPVGYEGIWVAPGFSGNHAHGNLVGYVGAQGRVDGRLIGCVEGEAEWNNNTHFGPGNPTRQTELDYIQMWRDRVTAAGHTIGAG